MEQKLSLKLGQRLVLTPTLQQAIKLLQLSKLELIQHIRQELDENPVLEELPAENALAEAQEVPASSRESEEPEAGSQTELPPDSPYQEGLDWSVFAQDDRREPSGSPGGDEDGREGAWYENVLSTKESLQDYLLWQLHLTLDGERELAAGEEIIGNIDDDGYLRAQVQELAAPLGQPEQDVERVLGTVQSFDPPGVGARDIRECLLLQLARLPEPKPLAETIVRDHLRKLENKNYPQIAAALKSPVEQIWEAARVISGLEPKPGRLFSTEEPQYITPDLYIRKEADAYVITLNDEGMPRLRLNSHYRRLLSDKSLPDNAREFINRKFSSALWLVKSIHQRQKTIYRVAESIVRHQRDFLDHGISRLRPMILRDVAQDIGVHESTVSRVTTRKYAQTPQGLFELKFFFNTGIEMAAGPSMASASVQNIIRGLVEGESPKRPLSDQEIAAVLKTEHGLQIARRTVAKYRKILRILPAGKRRKIVPCAAEENP